MKAAELIFPKTWSWHNCVHEWFEKHNNWWKHVLGHEIRGDINKDEARWVFFIHLDIEEKG